MKNILIGLMLTLVLISLVFFVFMFSGFYNLSATIPHMKITESAIHMMKERSIRTNSKNIQVPNLENQNLLLSGFKGYDEMCVTCHSAPGKSASVIADGLYPKPPELYNKEILEEWNNKELFWIIKNGIKLTGMPAYGPTHGDEDLWSIVAFINKLPEMSDDDYKAMKKNTKDIKNIHIHKDGKKHIH